MVYTLRFSSSKCSLFQYCNVFGSCIIHILYTGCSKIKKKYFRRQKIKEHSFDALDTNNFFYYENQSKQVNTLNGKIEFFFNAQSGGTNNDHYTLKRQVRFI
jgi:hypothetical protein